MVTGAAASFVAYDKVLEGRLWGKSQMEPIWRANGWDGNAPVTRHEARLRREALRTLGVPETNVAEFDDPWKMLEHLQDLFGYVVGALPRWRRQRIAHLKWTSHGYDASFLT